MIGRVEPRARSSRQISKPVLPGQHHVEQQQVGRDFVRLLDRHVARA
jgi:hypothetical protein